MKLMVKVKLLTTAEQHTCILKTMKAFNEACNEIIYRSPCSRSYRSFCWNRKLSAARVIKALCFNIG